MDRQNIHNIEQKLVGYLRNAGPQPVSIIGTFLRFDHLPTKVSIFCSERPHLFHVTGFGSYMMVEAAKQGGDERRFNGAGPSTVKGPEKLYVPASVQALLRYSAQDDPAQVDMAQAKWVTRTPADELDSDDELELLCSNLNALELREDQVTGRNEMHHCPFFTRSVLVSDRTTGYAPSFPMYGLFGKVISGPGMPDERLYLNTNIPLSGLICGVQGSGKSHSLNCILENYLVPGLGKLPVPLAALILHFDSTGGGGGMLPCESAHLGTPVMAGRAAVDKITVLVSPSNYRTMVTVYSSIPNCTVRPLFFSQGDLNIRRVMSLMAVDETEAKPLYMQVLHKLLRDMGDSFDYDDFRSRLEEQKFTLQQSIPLNMRLDLLDSFLVERVEKVALSVPGWGEAPGFAGGLGSLKNLFKPGEVVITDLSDPFIDSSTACCIFEIVVGLFSEVTGTAGKIVVLDEAHKYLTQSHGSTPLIDTLLSLIRQQRHLSLRTFISTQDPTNVPPSLLELSSFVIMHGFFSPAWFAHLKKHLMLKDADAVLDEIVGLRTGQGVVYAPKAVVGVVQAEKENEEDEGDEEEYMRWEVKQMGTAHQVVKVRSRVTADGGSSLLAVTHEN